MTFQYPLHWRGVKSEHTGPRTEPCATQLYSGIVADVFESIWTQWVRSSKYLLNHDNAVSRTPYSSCNGISKCSWSVVTNALEKSISGTIECRTD